MTDNSIFRYMEEQIEAQIEGFQIGLMKGFDLVKGKLYGWFTGFFESLPNLIVAVLAFMVFYYFAKLARKFAEKFFERITHNNTISRVLGLVAYYFVIFEGLFVALNALDLEKTVAQLLTGAGIIGIGLTLAFQSIATNLISGVIIAAQRPFNRGDLIEIKGHMGVVQDINLRVVTLLTFDGQHVLVPCKDLTENPMINYFTSPSRRVSFSLRVSYTEDLERVREITTDAIRTVSYVSRKEDTLVVFKDFAHSAIHFDVIFWVEVSDNLTYMLARSEAIMAVKKAYNQHDIAIPFPVQTLDFGVRGGTTLKDVLRVSKS